MIIGKRIAESYLDVLNLNHKVIANNIANVDAPHYKARAVTFQEALRKQLELEDSQTISIHSTHAKHIDSREVDMKAVPFKIQQNHSTTYNHNQNNVDIDMEMASMAKNQMAYTMAAEWVGGYYTKQKKILKDLV